ncbi:hypothetical protein [Frankia sp. QA3]|uniref:hypothetical protein n=1 Tax=Frankia sp. QA3 TaxID=710111 RepID=UPI0002E65D01|nr:hypothetical protein [Frankia sp. QA3]
MLTLKWLDPADASLASTDDGEDRPAVSLHDHLMYGIVPRAEHGLGPQRAATPYLSLGTI